MPTVVARYDYMDANGDLLCQKERLAGADGKKSFRWRQPDPNGGWIYGRQVDPVLYRLPQVLEAKRQGQWIVVVEGEKDVETLEKQGKVATTGPDGGGKSRDGKWRPEYTEALRGAKVAVISDADWEGRQYAWTVMHALDGVAAAVKGYEPTPPYKDITEQIEAGVDYKKLVTFDYVAVGERMVALTEQERATKDVEIHVMTMDELMATPDIAPHDKLLEHMILRGSRFVVGAYTGEGKTTLALQILRTILRGDDFLGWNGLGNGTRALVIDVEQGRRTVKRRFVEAHLNEYPDQVRLVWVPDGLALDQNVRHVRQLERVLANGLDGKPWDVVIADPLYKLHQGNPNDERKAVDLMRQFDRWREGLGFALFLPMHCRKPQPGVKFAIHDISGSSAYTHGAEVIVGLQRVSNGFSHLHWWKDREGDLGCIGERWDLLHDHEGFRRDPRQLDRQPVRDRVRHALEATPGMTIDDLREETSAKQSTLQRVLADIGAIHDGERLVKSRRWRMPPTLFGLDDNEAAPAA